MQQLLTEQLDIWISAQAPQKTGGRGRGKKANRAISPYGIKKLRELILELAVRGKLVAQNPNDEPASVLLERIAEEKARFIKEGKIKKQKKPPKINEEEKPFDLPKGWEWVRLGAITQINPRNIAKDSSKVAFVPMPLITTSHVGDHGQEVRTWGSIKKGYTHFADGDIGLAKITPCFENSKAVVFSGLKNSIGAGTTELHIARPFGLTLFPRFALIYLKSPQLLREGASRMTGTAGQKRVPKDFFSGYPFPLPPLAEQHRIVAKVDELMGLCDRLEKEQADNNETRKALLETLLASLTRAADHKEFSATWQRISDHFHTLFVTEESIDQLKQTILQLAVMGKLVPQDTSDEPASVLLEKIAQEKARLIKEGKIKKQKKLPKISEEEKPFDLPVGWEWSNLAELFAVVTDGDHQAPPKSDLGIPFLVIGNLNTGKIKLDSCKYVPVEYYNSLDWGRKPVDGDILYTVTGSYGIPILVDINDSFCVQRHVAILKSTDSTPQKYLALIVGSKFAFEYATSVATGIAQKTVPLTGLRKMPVSLPPLAEQHRIVAKVEELMALCDILKTRLTESQNTQIHLADAMVEQAVQ